MILMALKIYKRQKPAENRTMKESTGFRSKKSKSQQ
jgi:hypothetical protein